MGMHDINMLEQSILGVVLEDSHFLDGTVLHPSMFTAVHHRNLLQCMLQLKSENMMIDIITLIARFGAEHFGGASYLQSLQQYANEEKFEAYCELLQEQYKERRKLQLLHQAQQENWKVDTILEHLDQIQDTVMPVDTSIKPALMVMHDWPFLHTVIEPSITTGMASLNRLLEGFKPGELTILAARPSMGKTDVMTHFALAAGREYTALIFSLEMSRDALLKRMIAQIGGFNRHHLHDPYGRLSEQDKLHWSKVLNSIYTRSIEIDERSILTVEKMRVQVRRTKKNHPGKPLIVFIDYLQIMQTDESLPHVQAIGKISRSLKALAKDFECPVICLSQLNRNSESRIEKRPMLSDIRDSGNIEQDADVVLLLYRDSYYSKEKTNRFDPLEIIVAKHRNGSIGKVKVLYDKTTGRIQDNA